MNVLHVFLFEVTQYLSAQKIASKCHMLFEVSLKQDPAECDAGQNDDKFMWRKATEGERIRIGKRSRNREKPRSTTKYDAGKGNKAYH